MPYRNVKDLPESVRHVLPAEAQAIYLSAFNHAHEEYKNDKKSRQSDEDLEATSHKVAWTAVKNKYKKNDNGHWIEKSSK